MYNNKLYTVSYNMTWTVIWHEICYGMNYYMMWTIINNNHNILIIYDISKEKVISCLSEYQPNVGIAIHISICVYKYKGQF